MAATNHYYKTIHHHHSLRRRHSISCPPSTLSPSSFYLKKPNTTTTSNPLLSQLITCSISSTSSSSSSNTLTSSSTSEAISFDLLEQHLSSKNFRQADEETRRLLIVLAGEAAQKRGYVFFSEVQFISEDDLNTIDELWRKYSDNKFGYSVQKKIWNKVNPDFTKFFIKVGWMKKLDTEVLQYNYKSFPTEFIWELNDDTPEGHLPLTNALRGTQLLNCILNHPAFKGDDQQDEEDEVDEEKGGDKNGGLKPLSKRVLKTDYSF